MKFVAADHQCCYRPVQVEKSEAVGEGDNSINSIVLRRQVSEQKHTVRVDNKEIEQEGDYSHSLIHDLQALSHGNCRPN